MRARVDVCDSTGLRYERTPPMGSEQRREAVYRDDTYIGEVVYIARRRKARTGEQSSTGYCTEYGWRPDGWRYPNNAKLTDRAGAVARLRTVV